MEFLYVFLLIFTVFGVSFVLINLRQVVTGKEFHGTCSSNNLFLKNKVGECTVCGKKPDEDCKMPSVDKG